MKCQAEICQASTWPALLEHRLLVDAWTLDESRCEEERDETWTIKSMAQDLSAQFASFILKNMEEYKIII